MQAAALVRGVHIGAGFVALFVAPGAMLTRKGGAWHRRWGQGYFWAMAVVAATAVALAFLRPNPLLFLIALFSFYLAFSGYRALFRKSGNLTVVDWSGVLLTLAGGVALVGYGSVMAPPALAPVAVALGLLAVTLATRDLRGFLRPPTDKRAWWFAHMGNMLGAYIATVSAFSVVNFGFLPPLARWLWPTVVGVPLILAWTRSYRRRFAGKPG